MSSGFDFEAFRLRRLVGRLIATDDVEIHDERVALADLSGIIEASDKAVLFRQAGPQRSELVAGVMGSRRRVAAAMGVPETGMAAELMRRSALTPDVVEVPSGEAPVHQVVRTGADIDLTTLPFHLQHDCDGGPYLSSAIDYSVDPASGHRNVGCRRLMLRSRDTLRSNLSQPSDLQRIYRACVARGERLPVSFVVGSSPMDFMAAVIRVQTDEVAQVARMRGSTLAVVKGVTNGIAVPADAEMVIEGYFDELGYRELEGPFGEFWGYYGPVHIDPVFQVTAITMRRDVLHQTLLHGGRKMARMEMAPLAALHGEVAVWRALRGVGIEPVAVCVVQHAAPRQHVRVSMRQAMPGQARFAISCLFALQGVKHVVVTDEDIDLDDDHEVEWAMSTRFRPDRDLVVESGFPAYYADPTAEQRTVAKIGFDCTMRSNKPGSIEERRPRPPVVERRPRYQTVEAALAGKPMYFRELMDVLGSDDGRELTLELDTLREAGRLGRLDTGEWRLIETGEDKS